MGIFSKKTQKAAEKAEKIERIEVEDLLENGYTCKETAAELGLDIRAVYRIKNARERRQQTLKRREIHDGTGVADIKREIALIELQIKKDELEHKRKENIKALREMAAGPGDDNDLLASVLPLILAGKGAASIGPPQPPQPPALPKPPGPIEENGGPPPIAEPLDETEALIETAEIEAIIAQIPIKIRRRIQKGKITRDEVLKYAAGLGVEMSRAEVIYNKIKGGA